MNMKVIVNANTSMLAIESKLQTFLSFCYAPSPKWMKLIDKKENIIFFSPKRERVYYKECRNPTEIQLI